MTGTVVDAAIPALADAIRARLAAAQVVDVPVGVGFPPNPTLPDAALFITGAVSDWRQEFAWTPQGQPLTGGISESFILNVFCFRRRLAGTLPALMADIAPLREAVCEAVRYDHTLGGTLGSSGMARVESLAQDESMADDRTRELGLTIAVRCDALITT